MSLVGIDPTQVTGTATTIVLTTNRNLGSF